MRLTFYGCSCKRKFCRGRAGKGPNLNSSRSQTPTVRHGTESSVAPQNLSQLIPLREAKGLIEDLFSPKPAAYWSDFLITLTIAYGFAAMYFMAAAFSLIQITALLVSGVALFRVGTFIHEIVHMPQGSMVGFRIAWNLICGVPLLMHSLLYSNHLDHHNPRKYGKGPSATDERIARRLAL